MKLSGLKNFNQKNFKCEWEIIIFSSLLLTTSICLIPVIVWAVAPEIVPTFENLGISWAPNNLGANETAKVQYRLRGSGTWFNAQDLWFDDRGGSHVTEYRGSIVNLNPGTVYEVKLTLSPNGETVTLLTSTQSDNFPEGATNNLPASISSMYVITDSGTADAYRVYDGEKNSTVINTNDSTGIRIASNVHHVILRNVTLIGGRDRGIQILDGAHDIVIEKNNISGWSSGASTRGAIECNYIPCGSRFTIQHNIIGPPGGDASGTGTGQVALQFTNSGGEHVIRYNTIYGKSGHMLCDAISGGSQWTAKGALGDNTDIYGNYISGSLCSAIEPEGGAENIRIWHNYITDTWGGVSMVPADIGPVYIFRNVFGKRIDSPYWGSGQVIKTAKAGSLGAARIFIYHNTVLQVGPLGHNFWINETNDGIENLHAQNNIVQLDARSGYPDGRYFDNQTGMDNCSNDLNYNLWMGNINRNCASAPYESRGIAISGVPDYDSGSLFAPDIDTIFSQYLDNGADGHDDGIVLPNFNDGYEGSGPDMGAVERGSAGFEFGADVSNMTTNDNCL